MHVHCLVKETALHVWREEEVRTINSKKNNETKVLPFAVIFCLRPCNTANSNLPNVDGGVLVLGPSAKCGHLVVVGNCGCLMLDRKGVG